MFFLYLFGDLVTSGPGCLIYESSNSEKQPSLLEYLRPFSFQGEGFICRVGLGGSGVNKRCDGAPASVFQADGGLLMNRHSGFIEGRCLWNGEIFHHFQGFTANVWGFYASKVQICAFTTDSDAFQQKWNSFH